MANSKYTTIRYTKGRVDSLILYLADRTPRLSIAANSAGSKDINLHGVIQSKFKCNHDDWAFVNGFKISEDINNPGTIACLFDSKIKSITSTVNDVSATLFYVNWTFIHTGKNTKEYACVQVCPTLGDGQKSIDWIHFLSKNQIVLLRYAKLYTVIIGNFNHLIKWI